MEQHYVFLKGNRVMNIAVFDSKDEELADHIAQEQGYDDAVWVGDNKPAMFSTWDGITFTEPTLDDLYDLGISQENTAMVEARLVAEAKIAAELQAKLEAEASAKQTAQDKLKALGLTDIEVAAITGA